MFRLKKITDESLEATLPDGKTEELELVFEDGHLKIFSGKYWTAVHLEFAKLI